VVYRRTFGVALTGEVQLGAQSAPPL